MSRFGYELATSDAVESQNVGLAQARDCNEIVVRREHDFTPVRESKTPYLPRNTDGNELVRVYLLRVVPVWQAPELQHWRPHSFAEVGQQLPVGGPRDSYTTASAHTSQSFDWPVFPIRVEHA